MDTNTTQQKTLQPIPIGAPGRPYPKMSGQHIVITPASGNKKAQSKIVPSQLEVLEKPVVLYSERPYGEVMGMAYRDMPTPSMLEAFYRAVHYRSPFHKRKLDFYIGGPGSGKSHLAKLVGNMRSKSGPIMVDCGGKSLDELLFETVLDVDAAKDLFDRIDERLAKKALNPLSVELLRKNLGKGWVEGQSGASVDWKAIGEPESEQDTEDRQVKLNRAIAALEKVKELEGMHGLGSSLGIKTQYGPLIRGWIEGREVVLDEYNKGKPATDGRLQIFWQFCIGEIDRHTVEGGAGLSFTFDRKDMKHGFFVTLTGNTSEDGVSTSELARSSYDRLSPLYIPEPTEADMQHRICQALTGVPISTIHAISKDLPDKQPKKFLKLLKDIRYAGLTPQQRQEVPLWQVRLLENWPQVMNAAEKLAKFYKSWGEYLDPNKEGRPTEIIMETDEMYARQVNPGMRMMLKHVMHAITPEPESVPVAESRGFDLGLDWQTAPVLAVARRESEELRFGARLCKAILNEIANTTINRGKPNLYSALMGLAAQNGIAEADLQEATANTQEKTVAQLLNVTATNVDDLNETRQVQKAFADLLRQQFSSAGLSSVDDEIVTVEQIRACLTQYDQFKDTKENNRTKYFMVPNPDYLNSQSVDTAPPFILVPNDDMVATPEELRRHNETGGAPLRRDPEVADLLETRDLLWSLSIPEIRQKNLDALWNHSITDTFQDKVKNDPAVHLAENRAAHGVAVTTVITRNADQKKSEPEELRILRYRPSGQNVDRVLILGESHIEKDLQDTLKNQGVLYFDRNDWFSAKSVKSFVDDLTRENPAVGRDVLLAAFELRHDFNQDKKGSSGFDQLFSAPARTCCTPNYILGASARPSLELKKSMVAAPTAKAPQPVSTLSLPLNA